MPSGSAPSCGGRSRGCAPSATRRAGRLALRGFQSTLRGVEAQIDFHRNDRGNIRAATRDARRANAGLGEGARLLRAAGRQLGVRVGTLNGIERPAAYDVDRGSDR